VRALWRQAAPDHIEDRLRVLDRPVIVVRGTRDRICPHDWAAALAGLARRGRLVEIDGAAHLVVSSHPVETAALLAGVVGAPSLG
jgi:pimeloyl-ACP methyl ester carboxylesterase